MQEVISKNLRNRISVEFLEAESFPRLYGRTKVALGVTSTFMTAKQRLDMELEKLGTLGTLMAISKSTRIP